MTQKKQVDVLVVGAGTSGSYLAWRLGQRGVRVLVLEKKPLQDLGHDLDIFHMDAVRFDQFGVPYPTGDELIGHYATGLAWSPDLQVANRVDYAFYVMHKPAFHQRLHGYVFESGGEIWERAPVTEVLVEDKAVVGLMAEREGETWELRAPLVVDASGIDGAVRTRLPKELGVETDPITANETLYVCLEFREDVGEGYPTGLNFYPFHKAFWNPSRNDGSILGIGQPGSFDIAWQRHAQWREEYFGDPGRVVQRKQGRTPFRRSPYSLVGNGFLVVGDAAFQTKPFSGEGVTSSFTACQLAAEVAAQALRSGDVSRKALWPYNVDYFRDQGAKFASLFVQLPAAAELSRQEVDFLFHNDLIFSGEDFRQMNLNYETEMTTADTVAMAAKLLWGVARGRFSMASLQRLLKVSSTAAKIKALYQRYPEDPARFDAWVVEAQPLWGES